MLFQLDISESAHNNFSQLTIEITLRIIGNQLLSFILFVCIIVLLVHNVNTLFFNYLRFFKKIFAFSSKCDIIAIITYFYSFFERYANLCKFFLFIQVIFPLFVKIFSYPITPSNKKRRSKIRTSEMLDVLNFSYPNRMSFSLFILCNLAKV